MADSDASVTVDLSHSATFDLDLYVLQGDCAPSACIATGESQATFDAVQDKTYYLVVDSESSNAGSFTLDVSCTP